MLKLLTALNFALLLIFPIAWAAPLARAGLLPWFGMEEMTVLTAIGALLDSDVILAIVVIFFAIVAPMVKTLALSSVHLGWTGPQALPTLEVLGKLAMADIFMIAIYIVAAKGVGVGRIETAWGLYLFTFAILASMLVTHLTKRLLKDQS